MAPSDEPSLSSSVFSASNDTALCLIPPRHLWEPVDRLRSLHDKAYNRWPPHVNLVYPFVQADCLPDAVEAIRQLDLPSIIQQGHGRVSLDETDVFLHKQYNTVHLRPANGSDAENVLEQLSRSVRGALGRSADEQFRPHMTVAQSYDSHSASHHFLVEKVRAVAGLSWGITELAVLVRDRGAGSDSPASGAMKVWGYISIDPVEVRRLSKIESLYSSMQESPVTAAESALQTAYHYSPAESRWVPFTSSQASATPPASVSLDRLIVASYNVLGEFEWPPNQERYPNLISHIVSDRGVADIVVLEEVTDHFLQYLLADDRIRSRYSYATHGPSNQDEVGPLPNHLNIAVLSRFELQWSYLPFQRKHKGASIVRFPSLRDMAATADGSDGAELILAACHLTHGLVDGAVMCRKNEVARLLDHLASRYGAHPQIIAGDFNMPTSSYTMDMARKTRHLSLGSYRYLRDFDSTLAEAGWQDTWLASRIQSGESSASTSSYMQESSAESYEGEQGATFDPLSNRLAARLVGNGLNNRPQRYDRILVNRHLRLRPGRFNMFGLEAAGDEVGASDHWGIRCLLTDHQPQEQTENRPSAYIRSIKTKKAPDSFGGLENLNSVLQVQEMLPTENDASERRAALHLLARVLESQVEGQAKPQGSKGAAQFILAPVGSYGLGVWTRESDLDLLCIGSISHKTFIKLAVARLRKGAPDGITIIRKIKASTGTMLLLDVNGINVDLHYCGAASILEQFPNVLNRPSTDAVFSLPIQTLYKLKPLRDVSYLRRSIPDMAQYKAAHIFLKAWANSRGLYGPRFGLLGGIHITALLVPVIKMLANDVGSVSVGDMLITFFAHYAQVDWKSQVVLDPFFHGGSVNHRRLEREPMCLLGWHAPALNTALNASAPTVHTISTEMARAHAVLSQQGMTWDRFLGNQTTDMGAMDFLKSHELYVRIDVNYWGSSSQKRNSLVGWLESRCVMLLVDLDRKTPKLTARIWPRRFMEGHGTANAETNSEESLEYHGCYLIGLDWVDPTSPQTVDGYKDVTMGDLQRALTLFSERIHGDANYYDPNTCWMGASVVEPDSLGQLKPDHRQVGENAGDDGLDDGFDSDEEEEEDVVEDHEMDVSRSKVDSRHSQTARVPNLSGTKLRTSTDVMNRIRWDPGLDSADYIIGYDDRFTGIQEKRLDEWKSELTDEEFIPQHRVMYFKRRSDGEVVWDRRTRVDKIFGQV